MAVGRLPLSYISSEGSKGNYPQSQERPKKITLKEWGGECLYPEVLMTVSSFVRKLSSHCILEPLMLLKLPLGPKSCGREESTNLLEVSGPEKS